jgi:hypothetical protein
MIRSRLTFLIICCVTVTTTTAQQIWNNTYIADRPVMLFSSVVMDDTTYKVIGLAANKDSPFNAMALVANIDGAGVLNYYKTETNNDSISFGVFLNTLIKTNSNDFAFTGYIIDTVSTLLFARIDKNLDSFKIYGYTTPNTYAYFGNALIQANDNYLYVAGIKTDNQPVNGNVCLVKIDTNGNRIWEKFYNQYKLDDARSIIQLANGNLMLGAVRNDLNQTNERANTWLLEVDTGGNIVRQWFDPNDSTYVAEGLRQTQDGGFIYGGKKKVIQIGITIGYVNSLVKVDSNFNKQWVYETGYRSIYSGFTDIEELSDGSFVVCGQMFVLDRDTNILYGCVSKLSRIGNLIWERTYQGINATNSLNFLSDIDVLPDGGLIAVGQCQLSGATPPQVGWFLKLDSNGCEVENCLVGIDDPLNPPKGDLMQVWPNPASGAAWVNIEYDMLGAELRVYDVTGKQMLYKTAEEEVTEINVTGLSSGMYVIIAEKEGRFARAKLVVE